MKRFIAILVIAGMCAGCANITGRDVGNVIGMVGAVTGAVLGFDPFSGASLAVGAGGVLVGAAVEDAIDNPKREEREEHHER